MTLEAAFETLAENLSFQLFAGGDGSGWFTTSPNPHVAKARDRKFLTNLGLKFEGHRKGADRFVSADGNVAVNVISKGGGDKVIQLFKDGVLVLEAPRFGIGVLKQIADAASKTFQRPSNKLLKHDRQALVAPKQNVVQEPVPSTLATPSTNKYADVEHNLKVANVISSVKLGGTASAPSLVTFADHTKGIFKDDSKEPCGARIAIGCGQQAAREAGAWEISKIVGLDNMLSPTVPRSVDGSKGVVSKWIEDARVGGMVAGAMRRVNDKTLAKAALFDYVIGNADRHNQNWLLDSNDKLVLIDHGLSFPKNNNKLIMGLDPWAERGHSKFVAVARDRNLKLSYGNASAYIANKDNISSALEKVGLPKEDIAALGERIDRLAKATYFKDDVLFAREDVPAKFLKAEGTQDKWKLQGKTKYQGLTIYIENKKGSIRSGKEPGGKPWSVKMPFDYGYIKGTKGVDGDEVDCFIGPNKKAEHVFIVHQRQNKGGDAVYDEDKCFLGWDSADEAKEAYHSAYNNVDLFHSMTMMSIKEFKEKLQSFEGKKLHASLMQAGGPGSGCRGDNCGRPKGGEVFVSPNVRENVKFNFALKLLQSVKQKAFETKAKQVVSTLAHNAQVRGAIGVWADGAENSTEITLAAKSETQSYISALLGKMANQKAVLNWQPSPSGSHALYVIASDHQNVSEMHSKLASAGIDYHTMVPEGDGSSNEAIVLDTDGSLGDKIGELSQKEGYETTRRFGTGTFIGSWTSRAAGKTAYNKIISAFESKHPDKAYYRNLRLAAGGLLQRIRANHRRRSTSTLEAGGPGSGRHSLGVTRRPIANMPEEIKQWHKDEVNAWLNKPSGLKVTSTTQEMLDPAKLKVTQDWISNDKLADWKDSGIDVKTMPPVTVVRTKEGDYLFDGSHRAAYAKMTNSKVPATVHTVVLKKSIAAGGPGSGRHPEVILKRAKDFRDSGEYEVHVDGVRHPNTVFRSPDNSWWYENVPNQHYSKSVVGFNKADTIEHFQKMYGKDIKAGGPGSGRHPWGRKPKILTVLKHRAVFLQKHNEANTAYQAKLREEQYAKYRSQGLNMRGKPILSAKQQLAKKSVVTNNADQQAKAEQVEQQVTKALGGVQSGNNSPMDVTATMSNGKIIGLEVKTLLSQKNDKITMNSKAIARKSDWAKKNKATIGTVAVDIRGSSTKVYYKLGIGSFRIGSMHEVQGGLKGLAQAIGGR